MKIIIPCLTTILLSFNNIYSQQSALELMTSKQTVPFTMPDGVKLMTDVYLPVTNSAINITMDLSGLDSISIELLPENTQYLVYDSVNGQPADNPYRLPLIFSRTPYDKATDVIMSSKFAFLGYAFAIQDMRGRYSSEGVYLPMYSDSWDKNPYHPGIKHILDITDFENPHNANRHEDGYYSIQFIADSLRRIYHVGKEENNDTFLVCNGSIGMVGASALGNTQYQAALAHKIKPDKPGLKCLFPIVATAEHYKSTAVQNGVFREALVTGWLYRQIESGINDEFNQTDTDLQNNIHSSTDYGLEDKNLVADQAINHFITKSYNGLYPGYYPNSPLRSEMDASFAPVDSSGNGDSNGNYSRYSNMNVPACHLTGWWDIFIEGQIETFNQTRKYCDESSRIKQKLIIGPWAHQTIGNIKSGDITYPENVLDFVVDISDFSYSTLNSSKVINSEFYDWFRTYLNYNDKQVIGEPKFFIHKSEKWQNINDTIQIRIPASDFKTDYMTFINYLAGQTAIEDIDYEIKTPSFTNTLKGLPKLPVPILPTESPVIKSKSTNFLEVAAVRLYVVGPLNDGIVENEHIGNYWLQTDSFPFSKNIERQKFYFHDNHEINITKPVAEENSLSYIHDPDNPVLTIGGANMIVQTPQNDRKSQGQMNLADPDFVNFTMERPDVLSFLSREISDSLCIVGFPTATIYMSSQPVDVTEGMTDTDFFIRIIDVYPDGREYFVVEGAVNARAREYAQQLVNGEENIQIPFTNIQIGVVYEFSFRLMPIAYTFGKSHKIKILISSSNYPRYQVNPNLPIADGEFFRRQPGDGKSYLFENEILTPRLALQSIVFSNEHPTHIDLPVFTNGHVTGVFTRSKYKNTKSPEFCVFPNPAMDFTIIKSDSPGKFYLKIITASGKMIQQNRFNDLLVLNIGHFAPGLYFIYVENEDSRVKTIKKLIIH